MGNIYYDNGIRPNVVIAVLCAMTKEQQNDPFARAVGARLRQLRESRGLSQEQVLFLYNVYLSNIENGNRNIFICTLMKLCKAYGVTLGEFFEGMKYDAGSNQE